VVESAAERSNLHEQGEFSLSLEVRQIGVELLLVRGDERGCNLALADVLRRATPHTELVKACLGRSKANTVRVLDLFAGWGMDAFTLAARGASVECWETHPAVCALLRDLQRRAPAALSMQLEIRTGCAETRLAMRMASVDVIYLDPMFPPRNKQALPGKRLQYLAELVESKSPDLADLIGQALALAPGRVVVKRRRHDALLVEPSWQIKGTSVRYDIYVP
jgi:16S rRNA (guanine1516-N2)-methyltransferase